MSWSSPIRFCQRPMRPRPSKRLRRAAIPYAALARLPRFATRPATILACFPFLARAPQACLILLAAGTGALVWTRLSASTAPLEREFVWAASVLTFIAAITGLHILSYAQRKRPAPMPLDKAATRLRSVAFLYRHGLGLGRVPDNAGPAVTGLGGWLCGRPLPVALGLLLRDQKGTTAFAAPVTLATASAACLGPGLTVFGLPPSSLRQACWHSVFPCCNARCPRAATVLPVSPTTL